MYEAEPLGQALVWQVPAEILLMVKKLGAEVRERITRLGRSTLFNSSENS